MPVALPIWAVAHLKATRPELRGLLGEPHYVETDPTRTCGGEQDGWAFSLPSGQRVLVLLDVTTGRAALFADPPNAGPALRALGLSREDPRLTVRAEPWEMK
jgi:hypothetical protein